MSPEVYKKFEEICSSKKLTGSVLEIGALPNSRLSLLNMKALNNCESKIGINLSKSSKNLSPQIVQGNANNMDMFADNTFDVVLCNALIEHDKYFWKTVEETKRVTKPGGFIIFGGPAFVKNKDLRANCSNPDKRIGKLPKASTLTFEWHGAPSDYYRFSKEAFKEIILGGLEEVEIFSFMLPPRIIGCGFTPRLK